MSELPSSEADRYDEPSWSLSGYCARLESFPDGSMRLTSMRGPYTPMKREPFNGQVPRENIPTDLPRVILESIGERPEDITKLLHPRRARSNKRMQLTREPPPKK